MLKCLDKAIDVHILVPIAAIYTTLQTPNYKITGGRWPFF